jgi:hypothetical protein
MAPSLLTARSTVRLRLTVWKSPAGSLTVAAEALVAQLSPRSAEAAHDRTQAGRLRDVVPEGALAADRLRRRAAGHRRGVDTAAASRQLVAVRAKYGLQGRGGHRRDLSQRRHAETCELALERRAQHRQRAQGQRRQEGGLATCRDLADAVRLGGVRRPLANILLRLWRRPRSPVLAHAAADGLRRLPRVPTIGSQPVTSTQASSRPPDSTAGEQSRRMRGTASRRARIP